MKKRREERQPQRWWGICLFVFIFKECIYSLWGSVFIVFGEDINKAEAREREVSNEGQGNNNRESDQELKGV